MWPFDIKRKRENEEYRERRAAELRDIEAHNKQHGYGELRAIHRPVCEPDPFIIQAWGPHPYMIGTEMHGWHETGHAFKTSEEAVRFILDRQRENERRAELAQIPDKVVWPED